MVKANGKAEAGEQPFAGEHSALVYGDSHVLALSLLQVLLHHPAPGWVGGAVLPPCLPLPPARQLQCALLSFCTFRLTPGTFQAYFCQLAWVSDPPPILSRTIHSFNRQ